MMFTTGFVTYGASVLNTRMLSDLGLDRKSLGIAVSSFSFCLAVFAPISGILIHRIGARSVLLGGTIALIVAALSMATIVNSLTGLTIFYGLIMGCGTAIAGGIPVKTVVSYWFRKRLAFAVTVTSIGTNAGGAIAAPLLAYVMAASAGSWRTGWLVVAAALTVSFIAISFFVRNQPGDVGQVIDGGDAVAGSPATGLGVSWLPKVYKTSTEWEFASMMRRPAAWWMLLAISCSASALSIIVGHGVAHFMDLGHSSQLAGTTLGTVIGAQLIARIIYAVIGDYIEPRFVWGGSLLLMAVGMLLVVDAATYRQLFASAALLGLGAAPAILCLSAMAVNYFGRTPFSRFQGVTMLGQAGLPAAVAVLTGIVFDRVGSYSVVFYSVAAVLALLGLVMPFVRPPRLK